MVHCAEQESQNGLVRFPCLTSLPTTEVVNIAVATASESILVFQVVAMLRIIFFVFVSDILDSW